MFALGAAGSKCVHVGETLLPPALHRKFLEVYLTKGALATTAIEGNTLSERAAMQIVRGTDDVPASRAYQKQAIQNIVEASNGIVRDGLNGTPAPLSVEMLKHFNRIAISGLPLEEGVVPGEFANYGVVVGRYRGVRDVRERDHLLQRLCEWLEHPSWEELSADRICSGLLKAVLAHLYFVWIHPFGDGNGRTARLIELKILFDAGVPMPCAHLLSNHYNQTRDEYYRRLDLASRSNDPYQFIQYAVQGFVDGLISQISRINKVQRAAVWREHVYEAFGDHLTKTTRRQRLLALALFSKSKGIPVDRIRTLTPEILVEYHDKSAQTVKRDLRALVERGLANNDGKRVTASFPSLMKSRLPRRSRVEIRDLEGEAEA